MEKFVDLKRKILELTEAAVDNAGYRLIDVSLENSCSRVSFYIERHDEMPVSISDCVQVSKMISPILDAYNVISHSYVLNVSSPGPNRPIRGKKDYEASIGSKIRVVMLDRSKIAGMLEAVDDNTLDIKIGDNIKKVSLSDVYSARKLAER